MIHLKRILMNDIVAPVDAFDLFPRKRHWFPRWIKALLSRSPRVEPVRVRTAVAKY